MKSIVDEVSRTTRPPLLHTLFPMTEQKGRRAIATGPTGMTVARNIARLRRRRDLTTRQLSAALERAGRPIPASGITRMEKGDRMVTADDLMALSVVLGVSPTALLLPVEVEPNEQIDLTGTEPVAAYDAWHWIEGGGPLKLPTERGAAGGRALYQAMMEYRLYGRPHWLVEMEDERADELARLTDDEYKSEGGTAGPPARSIPLDRLLNAAGFEATQREDGTIEVRPKPAGGGADG
jgi:transcriptional regulator with XRE-family HTH domain